MASYSARAGSGLRPHTTSRQPYYGPLYDQGKQTWRALEPWVRNLAKVGNVTPQTQERFNMQHGRYLSGIGAAPEVAPSGGDPRYEGEHLNQLERQDDVYGSGIFDGPDGPATANAEMGIFSSAYSLPGFVGREVPFAVSRDVTDITSGGAVVMIPAGGKAAIEARGKLVDPPVLGPTPRPPALEPPRPTSIDQVYVDLQRPQNARAPFNAGAPTRPMSTFRPPRGRQRQAAPLPWKPPSRRLPLAPPQTVLPYRSTVNPLSGTEESGATAGQFAVAGLMLGAAVAIFAGTFKAGK